VIQITNSRLVVSKKLAHAVQSYKARAGAGSQAESQAAPKELGAEVGSRAGTKAPQLGAEPRDQNLRPDLLFQLPALAFGPKVAVASN